MLSPNRNTQPSSIPVIDISCADEETGRRLVDAAAQYGFAFVTGEDLGFTSDNIARTFALV